MAWLDLMLNFQREMQRASWQSLSSYSPTSDTRITGRVPQRPGSMSEVVPVGEERLNVAVQTVAGETTRIRRRVVTQPVEQKVTLRDEKVVVERRPPTNGNADERVLTETVVEMSDSRQVPKTWKSLHVAEEVVLHRQVTERTETIRDSVRRDIVDVEHGASVTATNIAQMARPAQVGNDDRELAHAARAEENRGDAEARRVADDLADKKPGVAPAPRKA